MVIVLVSILIVGIGLSLYVVVHNKRVIEREELLRQAEVRDSIEREREAQFRQGEEDRIKLARAMSHKDVIVVRDYEADKVSCKDKKSSHSESYKPYKSDDSYLSPQTGAGGPSGFQIGGVPV
jgi:hypothetical protein